MTDRKTMVRAYYLAYEAKLVDEVNLNGYRSSSRSNSSLEDICKDFPASLMSEAASITDRQAWGRYETSRLVRCA